MQYTSTYGLLLNLESVHKRVAANQYPVANIHSKSIGCVTIELACTKRNMITLHDLNIGSLFQILKGILIAISLIGSDKSLKNPFFSRKNRLCFAMMASKHSVVLKN